MRILLPFFAFLLAASPVDAAIAFVQAASGSANATTVNVTLSVNGTSGNLLVCTARAQNANDITGITYNGTAMTFALEEPNAGDAREEQFYLILSAASTAIVVTASGSGQIRAICAEFSGVDTSDPYCSIGSCLTGQFSGDGLTTTSTSLSASTTDAGDLIVTAIGSAADVTFTAPTGFTQPAYTAVTRTALAYLVTSASGAKDIDWTFASSNIASVAGVYNAATGGGGGGGTKKQMLMGIGDD